MPDVPSAPLTLLFTDIEGSTRLARTLGDRFAETLEIHNRILRHAFAAHAGTEIDSAGDGFFVVFERARDAVAAAIEAQRALAGEPWATDAPVKVRIGIHTGEVTVSGERYRGVAVHRAARISAAARGGQILISQSTQTMVEDAGPPIPDLSYLDLGDHLIKDFDRPVRLYQLVAPGLADRFPPVGGAADERGPRTPADAREPEDIHVELKTAAAKVAELAETRGRPDLAADLRTELASPREPGTVVVVAGETKRGKSSLINALLGQELLPADADIATTTHVIVRYGPRTIASVLHAGNPAGEEVAVADLAVWATPWGNPNNEKGVRGIIVSLDHPLLARGVTLVDTPGVGGLEAAHASITKAALLTADVLLLVVDASAPLSRPELRFLDEATDRIETVFFALTKRDEYRGWEQVLAEDRALLAGTRYAQAPIFPVSSTMRLGASAFADGDPELARLVQEESGIDALEGALAERAAGKTTILRAENLLRISQLVLQRLDELEQAVIQAAGDDGGEVLAELQEAKETAAAFRVTRGKASRALERSFRGLGQQVELDMNRALAEVRGRYEIWLEAGKMAGLTQALESELQGVVVAVNTFILDRLEGILAELQEELEIKNPFNGAQSVDVQEGRSLAPLTLRSRSAGGGLIDVFGSITPVSMITMLAIRVLASSVAGFVIGAPIGLLLAGAIWTKRRSMRNQQQARAVLMEALDWARRELPPAIRDKIADLKDAVEVELLAALARREHELADAIAEYERVAGETATKRKEAREAALLRRKEIVELRAAVAALRSQLAQVSQQAAVTA